MGAGLSQREVAQTIGVSHSKVGRFERSGDERSLEFVGALCAVVGLDLAIRSYPAGDPIRDRAQLALLERLRGRLHPSLRWRAEVPLPLPGALRAWDADVRGHQQKQWRARIEAETRRADGQALARRLALKLRDDPGGHLILLVSDTRANRVALRSIGVGLRDSLPLNTRQLLTALAAGRDPRGSGIVIL